MPIYEYRCETCGETFETMQRMADAPLETCGDLCRSVGDGAGTVRRLISAHNVAGGGGPAWSGPDTSAMSCGRCGRPGGPGCGDA